jgi:hypothetical protein
VNQLRFQAANSSGHRVHHAHILASARNESRSRLLDSNRSMAVVSTNSGDEDETEVEVKSKIVLQ